MRRLFHLLPFLLLLSPTLRAQADDLSELRRRLFELPDVIFEALPPTARFPERYHLRVRQPLDHQHPERGHFYQHVILEHQGFDRPVLMNTNGYAFSGGPVELIDPLGANYLNVEHRYFGESRPEVLDWQYLTLEQVAADLHHINELLRRVYPGSPWVSSGISKGGQTTLYYRYFYPDDVEASVPYVAPLNRSTEDPRIYAFLDSIGTKSCREAIAAFQRSLLSRRDEVLPRLEWFAKGKEYTFNYLGGPEPAFEYAVLEYPFSFWQFGYDCESIPGPKAPVDELLDHFNEVVGLSLYSDEQIVYYAPIYYQAATEMGYYGYEKKPFARWLRALPDRPNAAFAPKGVATTFDPTLNEQVIEWVKTRAANIAFIYGGIDTWSATAADTGGNTRVRKYVLPGKHHGNARVVNMSDAMQADLYRTLADWLGREVKE